MSLFLSKPAIPLFHSEKGRGVIFLLYWQFLEKEITFNPTVACIYRAILLQQPLPAPLLATGYYGLPPPSLNYLSGTETLLLVAVGSAKKLNLWEGLSTTTH